MKRSPGENRVAALALVGLAVIALAGCGGSDEPRDRRAERDPRRARDPFEAAGLHAEAKNKLSVRDIERFARVRIPKTATGLQSHYSRSMDASLIASFTIPREDLDAFISGSDFSASLEPGYRVMPPDAGKDLGWRLGELHRVSGLNEPVKDHLSRRVLVDLGTPGRATVYLSVTTV